MLIEHAAVTLRRGRFNAALLKPDTERVGQPPIEDIGHQARAYLNVGVLLNALHDVGEEALGVLLPCERLVFILPFARQEAS
jgi:hypothetical protein